MTSKLVRLQWQRKESATYRDQVYYEVRQAERELQKQQRRLEKVINQLDTLNKKIADLTLEIIVPVSPEGIDKVKEMIENPPAPTEALQKLMAIRERQEQGLAERAEAMAAPEAAGAEWLLRDTALKAARWAWVYALKFKHVGDVDAAFVDYYKGVKVILTEDGKGARVVGCAEGIDIRVSDSDDAQNQASYDYEQSKRREPIKEDADDE